jgi:hypothetical protein
MRSALLVFLLPLLLGACAESLPNEPFDGAATAGDGAATPGETGERGRLPPVRLEYQGTLTQGGTATVLTSGTSPTRLPILQAWQQVGGVWSTDVVARIREPGKIELQGTAGATFQLLVLP